MQTWDHRPTRFVGLTAQEFPRPATSPGAREGSPHMMVQNPSQGSRYTCVRLLAGTASATFSTVLGQPPSGAK